MGSVFKRLKKKEYLTDEEVLSIKKELLDLKDESEQICKNENISKKDFDRLCVIGKTMAVYKSKLKKSLKYSGGN